MISCSSVSLASPSYKWRSWRSRPWRVPLLLCVHLLLVQASFSKTPSHIVPSQPRRMSTVQGQDSLGSLDSYLSDDLLEAPTLSSKEIKHAREQALKILKTKSPEEAFKIFTEGLEVKADNMLREKVQTATKPPKAADGKPSATVQPPPKTKT